MKGVVITIIALVVAGAFAVSCQKSGGYSFSVGARELTFKKKGSINETNYNKMFSAPEGYTLIFSGKKDEGNGYQSYTWSVRKSN